MTIDSTPHLDLAPSRPWRRFVPRWLRSLLWVDSARHYDAFLSYSWKSDAAIAPLIQSLIQRFLCPWYKPRAKTIFRDLSCLPAGSNVEAELRDRLDRSTHLILLACPEAATSHGMELEARHWFSRPRDGRLLIVLSSTGARSWEEIRDRLVPPALRNSLDAEYVPVWASVAGYRDQILATPNDHRLRGELIEALRQVFLAFYPERDWGQLRGEERSQRRRAIGLLSAVAAMLVVLALLAFRFGLDANQQRRRALARQLAAQSESLRDRPGQLQLSGLLAVESLKVVPTLEGMASLRGVLNLIPPPLASALPNVKLQPNEPVTLSQDGEHLATIDGEGGLVLWDLATARQRSLSRNGLHRSTLVFSGDGTRVAAGNDHIVRIWETADGSEMFSAPTSALQSLALSRDGRVLAVEELKQSHEPDAEGSESVVWVRNLAAKSEPFRWIGSTGDEVTSLALSDSGYYLARADGRDVQVWATHDSKHILWSSRLGEAVKLLAFSPSLGYLAVAGTEKINIYQPNDGALVAATAGTGTQRLIALAFGGPPWDPTLATASSGQFDDRGTIRIWRTNHDAERLEEIFRVETGRDNVRTIGFGRAGRTLIAAFGDGLWKAWQVDVGFGRGGSLPLGKGLLPSLSRYGEWRASLSKNGLVTVRDLLRGKQIGGELPAKRAFAIQISDDGRLVALADRDGRFQVHDVASKSVLLSEACSPPIKPSCMGLSFSADGHRLAVGGPSGVAVWDVAARHLIRSIDTNGVVDCVTMSGDGRALAWRGKKATIVTAVETGRELWSFDGKACPRVFTWDGKSLITSSDSGVEIWRSRTRHRSLQGTDDPGRQAVALSKNERWLAVAGRWLRVFDLSNGQAVFEIEVARPDLLEDGARAVAFSTDGTRLMAFGLRRMIGFAWREEDLIREACSRLERELSAQEWARYLAPDKQRSTCRDAAARNKTPSAGP